MDSLDSILQASRDLGNTAIAAEGGCCSHHGSHKTIFQAPNRQFCMFSVPWLPTLQGHQSCCCLCPSSRTWSGTIIFSVCAALPRSTAEQQGQLPRVHGTTTTAKAGAGYSPRTWCGRQLPAQFDPLGLESILGGVISMFPEPLLLC